jgi:alkaline phosphatase
MARGGTALRLGLVAVALASAGVAVAGGQGRDQPPRQARNEWFVRAEAELAARLGRPGPITTRAKNVILFVADGNGVSSNYATRLWAGQQRAGGHGDEAVLAHEGLAMPHLALAKTYNTNAQTPDSAGTASALNLGIKTKSGVLGLNETARYGRCEDAAANRASTLAETLRAGRPGARVGVVTTARVTHATPAGVYAHSADREWEAAVPAACVGVQADIGAQLVAALLNASGEGREGGGEGTSLDLALGGGAEMLTPAAEGGRRVDGRHLIREAEAAGAARWRREYLVCRCRQLVFFDCHLLI